MVFSIVASCAEVPRLEPEGMFNEGGADSSGGMVVVLS